MRIKLIFLCLLISCSTQKKDQLQNTKKLMKEGHVSLYENGAFAVPATKIKLIPPGPSTMDLASELTGVKAKESFLRYLKEVKESSVVIYEGTKKTYKFSRKVNHEVDSALSELAPKLKENSIVIMREGFATSKHIVGRGWDLGAEFQEKLTKKTKAVAEDLKETKFEESKFDGGERFIKGYVSLPNKLEKRKSRMAKATSFERFKKDFVTSEEFRQKASHRTSYLITDAVSGYSKGINSSFHKAKKSLTESDHDFGYSLAAFKALSWVVEGVLWQGIIKPVGKISAGAIGYAVSNGVIYPVMLVSQGGVTTSFVAIEVLTQSGAGIVEIAAPSAELGVKSLLYSGEYLLNRTGEGVAMGAGFVLENGTRYIVAPVGNGAIKATGAVTGAALGIGSGVLAGATRVSGEVMTYSSRVTSETVAGVTLAGGVTAYTLKGTGEVVYEIGKAAVVPPSLVLGSGLALSYGTVSQLSGQAVLAASDAAYLVLSLEGPSWVIYSVKGLVSKDDLQANAVVDLESLKKSGEEIRKLPVSEEEMKKVLESLDHVAR